MMPHEIKACHACLCQHALIFCSSLIVERLNSSSYHYKLISISMPTSAFIEDDTLRMTLLSAQPSGVANLASGQMDVMLDRRLNQDDGRGLFDDNIFALLNRIRLFTLIFEATLVFPMSSM
ncbi:Alpha-mannosidase [Dirofilaria immitis]|nr:Alpha-mannosidase [Dirofilaria immitis]